MKASSIIDSFRFHNLKVDKMSGLKKAESGVLQRFSGQPGTA
jgi:hypothetical protein